MPVTLVDPQIFATVLHPLATAPDQLAVPGLVQVAQVGTPTSNACADVFVFAGHDLEALHRTILGFSLTADESALNIQVCVFNPDLIDELLAAAQEWSRTYHLALKVTCYSTRTSEAQVMRHTFRGDRPRVFCRAGAVPRCRQGMSRLLQTVGHEPATLLFTNSANLTISDRQGVSAIPVSTLLSSDALPWTDRLVAAVVPAHVDPGQAPIPYVYTLEGFLLAQGLQGSGGEASVRLAPHADFVHSGTEQQPDEFYTRLDAYSLHQARTALLASKRRSRHHPRRMTA